ncbi:TetR/AcrR family transcriptional regulator [Faecalicatena contorta]|uniref:DNA-binding transcriptional regulator, AcrR family n=1 Tax=Faecalicatena contorta TaxID=39482 RepID=A0A315ZPG2_9FIRM|nr:TetR/AcrR family transcriptional regulator [Faecalicatena contorta]PWJ47182.1 TetR family transcriptional regulator [Faecalicatena contorta]SUQ16157.1 DNA-binding transcriptional regulator, AcrR family [Faecalicatena contorta]
MRPNDIDNDELKKANRREFINATKELMEEESFQYISIRKIAERAGFHNSTLYLYFKDLDQLLLLASMKYFREYSHSLNILSREKHAPIKSFISIWDFFLTSVLKNPMIFYNFFFGKSSDNLYDIMTMYYDIFPEEREQFSQDIEAMYFGRNITERSLYILRTILFENTSVTEENLHMLNELSVSYCKYKLELKCQNPNLDSEQIKKEILTAYSYLFGL